MFEKDWAYAYSICPFYQTVWEALSDRNSQWPEGFQLQGEFLFFETKLCVPTSFVFKVNFETHEILGHIGSDRLYQEILRRYSLPDNFTAKSFVQKICKNVKFVRLLSKSDHRTFSNKRLR